MSYFSEAAESQIICILYSVQPLTYFALCDIPQVFALESGLSSNRLRRAVVASRTARTSSKGLSHGHESVDLLLSEETALVLVPSKQIKKVY